VDPAGLELGLDVLSQGEGSLIAGAGFGGTMEGGEGVSEGDFGIDEVGGEGDGRGGSV